MRLHVAGRRLLASSSRLWPLGLLVAAAGVIGCAGSAIRSQSPEIEALAKLEASTRFVGDYCLAWGLGTKRIERAALVTGLANTGCDPPPGPQRATLLSDMQARGVIEPNRLLAAPSTALVWVHGFLPPGVRKGDRFDVVIEVPPDHDTTSLAGGWLMETRLAEMAIIGNSLRDGHELGIAVGPVLVDPVSEGTRDSKSKLRARVPGGGVSLTDREIGLAIAPEHRSFAMSKRLGDWINRRFHAVIRGAKRGVATPKTDRYIALEVPEVYRHNLPRYLRVVQSVAVIEPTEGRHARLQLLAAHEREISVHAPQRAKRAVAGLGAAGGEQGLEGVDAAGVVDHRQRGQRRRTGAAERPGSLREPRRGDRLAEVGERLGGREADLRIAGVERLAQRGDRILADRL